MAGMYLLSVNRHRLGNPKLARMTLLLGVAFTAFLGGVAFILPDAVGHVLPVVAAFSLWHYAKQDQSVFDAHVKRGGGKEPTWKAAVLGLACGIVFVAVVVGIALLVGAGI